MPLTTGTRLGPYEILSPIGAGGMGEVYKAHDTRLARDVAVKVLGKSFSSDPAYRARFEQEARAAGALNHPNVVAVYDIGRTDESIYVVSELLEGQTLRARMSNGPVPHRIMVEYAVQIARGVAAAYEKGIIHRDLKPENIFLTKDGGVKILDFGLAKMPRFAASAAAATDSPTELLSHPGLVIGTVGYMSPEQVRGHAVDPRSDIFSFGVILYGALACARAFGGDSPADTMSAILRSDPPDLPETVLPGLHLIVRRCLEKASERRFQTMRDLGFALEALAGGKSHGPQASVAAARRWSHKAAIGAALWFLAGAAAAGLLVEILPRRHSVSVKQTSFAQITDDSGAELYPSLAPDNVLIYASDAEGNWDIYAKPLGARDAVNLTRGSPEDDTQPSVSPDGKLIAFRSERNGGGIFVMKRDGSGVRQLAPFGYNPSWSPDGKEVLCADEGISRPDDRQLAVSRISAIEVASGRARVVFPGDGVQPRWSPHGQRIVY